MGGWLRGGRRERGFHTPAAIGRGDRWLPPWDIWGRKMKGARAGSLLWCRRGGADGAGGVVAELDKGGASN